LLNKVPTIESQGENMPNIGRCANPYGRSDTAGKLYRVIGRPKPLGVDGLEAKPWKLNP